MISLKKVWDMIENIFFILAFLVSVASLPSSIATGNIFMGILSVGMFFFFWYHFFWHRDKLSDCIADLYYNIGRLRGKN